MKNNKSMVFFDIDGTLLDREKQLPESAKQAIRKLQQSGIPVAIATGRSPFMFADLRKELGIDTYVSINGQFVVHAGRPVYTNPLDLTKFDDLVQHTVKEGHPLVYMANDTMKANKAQHPHVEAGVTSLKFSYPEVVPDYYRHQPIYQALLFCDQASEHRYTEQYDFTFIRWHELAMDVIPSGGSKAIGIRKLCEAMDIPMEQVVAFGDALNDIAMLKAVGTAVAMGNAVDEVKAVADIVTTDVSEDGIVNGLKQAGLL